MAINEFTYSKIPAEAEALRPEVRRFLADTLADYPPALRAQSWMGFDAGFSKALGSKGWLGMALPSEYGGTQAGFFARYVVSEELLAAGAPVSAHWIADRQSGPLINKFGTSAQKDRYLPAICRGESYFCIGMSEPNSGSDLASIKSTATRDGDGWRVNGQKVWTTNAHHSHYMIALLRTGGKEAQRHEGMSQFIVDLRLPGITVRPIRDLAGGEHFNEVFFDDVFLPGDTLIGSEGKGWEQVTAELAFERSGPERFLSSMALIKTLIDAIGAQPDALQAAEIGRLTARLATLRNMSLAVTAQLANGGHPAWAASCVKDLGNVFEQEIPELAQRLVDIEPRQQGGGDHAQVLAYLTQMAPSFSLRGGTREILRGIIARGLGVAIIMRELFESTIERLLADAASSDTVLATEGGLWSAGLWEAIEDSGFTLAGVPESLGGADAGWADLYVIARAAGRFAAPAPLTEALLANWLLGRCRIEPRSGSLSFAADADLTLSDGRVSGVLNDVPWGRHVDAVVAIAEANTAAEVVVLARQQARRIDERLNVAGEPRDTLVFTDAAVLDSAALASGLNDEVLRLGGALIRSAQIAGALTALLEMTSEYASQRKQFGKAIGSFQAIQQQLAVFAEQTAAAHSAVEAAFAQSDRALSWFAIAVAKVSTADAATQCANIAHAVHGAIGFTQEYTLQLFTRRLWAWRGEFGSATRWSQQIGARVCEVGGDGFWPLLTQESNSGVSA